MPVIGLTVARALSLALARGREKPAVRCGERVLSYADLDRASNRLANALLASGMAPGDRLAVILPNCPEYIILALACAKSGLVMVPHNYRFTADEHAFQLGDCGARTLIYSDRFAQAVLPASARNPRLQRICHGRSAASDTATLDRLMESGSDEPPRVPVREEDPFYLGYTSGTTGTPKGAVVTQRNRALAYHYWALEFGIREDDVVLHTGPFHHTAPFTFVLAQLFMGGQVVILDHFDADLVMKTIERERATWGFFVPYMLDRLIDRAKQAEQHDLSSFRMVISGASALPNRTKEQIRTVFPAGELHEFYGATEAGVITNLRPKDQMRKTRCVGRPVFDTEIEIRDENGIRLGAGETGDIWLRGPTVFSGYYNAPDKTKAVFSGDWCTLGDAGRMDEEGFVYILDRRKDVIKSGGVNVFPIEIEEALRAQAAVEDVAVIGVPDPVWGEAVHAVVVRRAGESVDEKALTSVCRTKLAGYKVPKSFEFRSTLPRNANGKVLKRMLREEFVERSRGLQVEREGRRC
jgi:long-chain acyl-CoA synthetase